METPIDQMGDDELDREIQRLDAEAAGKRLHAEALEAYRDALIQDGKL